MNNSSEFTGEDPIALDPGYLFSFNNAGTITEINATLLMDLGYSSKEVIGTKKISNLLTTASKVFFQTQIYPLLKLNRKTREVFLSFKTTTGGEIPVLLNIIVLGKDESFDVRCSGIEITNRLRFEQDIIEARNTAEKAVVENEMLVKLKDELHENQSLLEQRLRKLTQHVKENEQINEVVSHDLQEPLRKVSIFSSKLMEEFESSINTKAFSYIQKINTASEKMSDLIFHLQKYLSYDLLGPHISTNKLSEIVAAAKKQRENSKGDNAVDLVIDLQQDVEIDCDPTQVAMLFSHLMDNSERFRNPDHPLIQIRISCETIEQNIFKEVDRRYLYKEFQRITYSDNGLGFEEKSAEYIFDLFRKAHAGDGLGMGLSYCRKIMEMHHGIITAHSGDAAGATFTMIFPVLDEIFIEK